MWLSDQDGGSRIGNAQQLSGEEPADGRCSRSAARDKDAGQALLRFSRSLRRRKPSMVASRITDTVVRITAAAVMVGLMFSRMPLNISITTSSKLVAKANSAPDAKPGRISGRITRRKA